MFENFSHFLAYGSTDQETLRELTDEYNGLLVPGTIAAYQAEGTRGFVLSLSAAISKPYAIDPRTPLFQYRNATPKQSHLALARVLGVGGVVSENGGLPIESWVSHAATIAANWVGFNSAYTTIAPKQFDKYARRLGRQPQVADARLPTWILAPYLMEGAGQDVAGVNELLWLRSVEAAGKQHGERLRRVFAGTEPMDVAASALNFSGEELVVWIDNLDEVDPGNAERLVSYAKAVQLLNAAGKRVFALYGGYFAVMLRTLGLNGASHGIGFSEHRYHVELKASGGAIARFYVQRLHRYLPVEVASELWRQDPRLVESYFPGYVSRDPGEYSYHELMKLSVRARADEIERAEGADPHELAVGLRDAHERYERDLSAVSLSSAIRRRVAGSLGHLLVWSRALGAAA